MNNYKHAVSVSAGLQSGAGRRWCSHLNASLGQVDADSQPLPHADIWVLCLLEGFLQSLQLRHCERRAAAALLLLVAIPSLQNKLWREEEKQDVITEIYSAVNQQQFLSNCDEEHHREVICYFCSYFYLGFLCYQGWSGALTSLHSVMTDFRLLFAENKLRPSLG